MPGGGEPLLLEVTVTDSNVAGIAFILFSISVAILAAFLLIVTVLAPNFRSKVPLVFVTALTVALFEFVDVSV